MRILLADDHTLIRENLRDFLALLGPNVTVFEAGTLPEATEIASREEGLDLIILDLMMPGMRGLSGLAAMRRRWPNVPILFLSGSTRRDDIIGAMNLGAKGFIPKTISGKAMLSALRLILSGETYVPSVALDDGGAQGAGEAVGDGGRSSLDTLTRREREVLSHVAAGLPNKKIARELGLKEVTVKVHLQSVFRKLGVTNRTQAAAAALQHRDILRI